jgi:4,5-DOPA dioxygenase extradiol
VELGGKLLPAAFFGHGSPINTLAANRYSAAWGVYAATLPRPRAILVISAHWYTGAARINAARRPPTIHDFNLNFPPALFDFQYPAHGDEALVERVIELAQPARIERDAASWGIDHGAYCILAHAFPGAPIPVVELSIDRSKPPHWHYALATRLAPLRSEGVFIMGSGNVVHNLELADFSAGPEPYAWARRFDERVRELLAAGDHAALVAYPQLGADAVLSVPTPDHYLPLLYIVALQRAGESVSTIVDGFDFGAGSMLSVSIAA